MLRFLGFAIAILARSRPPRSRSPIPTVRCVWSSALPPAAARTSRRARSRQQLGNALGQQFYVENRLGANGTIAARAVAQSKPDGYSLLFSSSSIISTPYIYKNLGYDTLTDLRPIATVGAARRHLHAGRLRNRRSRRVEEFIALAKNERVLYGSPGVGNGLHLATEMFAKKAGIKLQHVPYKGASEVMTALLGGSVQMMFVTPPSVHRPDQGRPRPRAGLHRHQAVPGDPRRAADEGPRCPATSRRARGACSSRPARRRTPIVDKLNADDPQGAASPGGREHHAARRLHPRQPRRRRGGRVLPQGGRAGRPKR